MSRLTLFAALCCLAACSTTPRYDRAYGAAVRDARLAMTINPDAGANPDPVAGIDGAAAHEAMLRYQDSFKTPPPVVNVINIGTGSSVK
jgi:hypothetical protein